MNSTILVAKDFSDFLINRDENQGDGTCTGKEFREKFLVNANDENWWKKNDSVISLDFTDVDTIGPSWANEVFAYFTKFSIEEKAILNRIRLINISPVKLALIKKEIESGYKV